MITAASAGLAPLMPIVYVVAFVVIVAWRVVVNTRAKPTATSVLPVRKPNADHVRGVPARLVHSRQPAAERPWFVSRFVATASTRSLSHLAYRQPIEITSCAAFATSLDPLTRTTTHYGD
jgi:hypothetical protein